VIITQYRTVNAWTVQHSENFLSRLHDLERELCCH